MKKTLLLIFICLGLISCSKTPKQIIEGKVKSFIIESLDDPGSYQSVSFTDIDTIWTKFDESQEGEKLSTEYHNAAFQLRQAELNMNSDDAKRIYPGAVFEDSIKYYQKLSDSLKPIYDKKLSEFNSVPESFYIEHVFRAKNKLGGILKENIIIYFDENLNITGTNK